MNGRGYKRAPVSETCPDINKMVDLLEVLRDSNAQLRAWGSQEGDKRMEGRKVYVDFVNSATGKAYVRRWADNYGPMGKTSTLSIRRMYPHATGWKLINDVP